MQVLVWNDLSLPEKVSAISRPEGLSDDKLTEAVREIMKTVKSGGAKAISEYTERFDRVKVKDFFIGHDKLKQAWDTLPFYQQDALKTAKANIEKFHLAQMPKAIRVETMPGVVCQRLPRPIRTVGLYVPGGSAPLVSTLLMLAVPAKVAGVMRAVVMTPPGKDGKVNPAILAAAHLCGMSEVFACGGAQAIAAMAYGTSLSPACDKIFGPGNAYVATAKSIAAQEPGGPAIDLPAGPSEAMVLADKNANPVFVASDLLSQAEHDPLAQVICLCTDTAMAHKIVDEVNKQLTTLPRREIAEKSIASSRLIICDQRATILDLIDRYAPEHLIIQMDNPESYIENIHNAGSVFLGPWTPESVGDYASGTNHTLPTFGAARAYSGVSVESFMKYITVQQLTRSGLETLGPTVEIMAEMEDLEAHRRAVSYRLGKLSS